MIGWLAHWLGLDNSSGAIYAFWSGVGSDISELAIFTAVIGLYHRHNCHVKRCWRLGKHSVAGTPWTTCKTHHPTIVGSPTAVQVAAAHLAVIEGDIP